LTSDPERTRASLLQRVRNLGDQQSWNQFVELYGPIILRYLRRMGVADPTDRDLAQEVLTLVMQRIGTFEYDPQRGRFRAWLWKITRNRASRHFTESARQPAAAGGSGHQIRVSQVPDDACPDAWVEDEWQKRRLEVAIQRVRPKVQETTWQSFALRFFDGLSNDQIARRLGISTASVYTNICRVVRRLRKAVEETEDE